MSAVTAGNLARLVGRNIGEATWSEVALPSCKIGLLGALAAVVVLVGATGAVAKDFRPGDLRVCDLERCVPVVRREVVARLGPFYYQGAPPRVVSAPRFGASSFELRFRNGYVTGIVGSAKLDRFLSYGVHLGRFRRGAWYRVPALIARELRRLTARLRPIPITAASLSRSR